MQVTNSTAVASNTSYPSQMPTGLYGHHNYSQPLASGVTTSLLIADLFLLLFLNFFHILRQFMCETTARSARNLKTDKCQCQWRLKNKVTQRTKPKQPNNWTI
ncbi:uncharacterized protein LOC114804952 isoform X2 [Zeugodacus cucurbitae]|nr:uncharacterized protein LOC114804952 isoform X2 [Zeugodacus cucurbitae]